VVLDGGMGAGYVRRNIKPGQPANGNKAGAGLILVEQYPIAS